MKSLALNAVVIAATWLAGLVVVRYVGSAAMAADAGLAALFLIALTFSLSAGAAVASYLIASFLAFSITLLGAHALWGPHSVRGGPVHLSVMGAAFVGVALGFGLSTEAVRRHIPRMIRFKASAPPSHSSDA